MGLTLAYFGFRYNLPLTMRSGLYPLLQHRINGPIGHGVDAFALVGTIAGLATTLGYGAMQLAAGLNLVTGWDTSTSAFRIGVIVGVVGLAALSAASGLDEGVRRLSELNLILTFVLLGFVLVCGPTVFLLQAFSENIGHYASELISMSLRTFAYEPAQDPQWFGGWTILYWAWWISVVTFCGHVHRPYFARSHRARVHHRCAADSHGLQSAVDDGIWQWRHLDRHPCGPRRAGAIRWQCGCLAVSLF